MGSLTWNAGCMVGVEMIDHQHGVLLDALNELRHALKAGADCESVRLLLDRVTELARLHLDSEERLLARYEFPELEAYQVERGKLLQELRMHPVTCDRLCQHKQSDSVYALAEYLRAWFMAHTETVHGYGPWLAEHGVQ